MAVLTTASRASAVVASKNRFGLILLTLKLRGRFDRQGGVGSIGA
jgi:hypothetical protein